MRKAVPDSARLKQRLKFVEYWAECVKTHDDRDWSRQQNVIIDSCVKNAAMTKKQFLLMKRRRKR